MVAIVAVLIAVTAVLGVIAIAELVPARDRSVGPVGRETPAGVAG